MTCDDYILKYLISNFSTCEILNILRENSLYLKFASRFSNKDNKKLIALNQLYNSFNIAAVCKIICDIEKMHVEYIFFKGFLLSQRLYGSPDQRACGDIDFYVESQYFDKVYFYLLEQGFELVYKNGLSNPHHVVLSKGRKGLELHRNLFHPIVGINENFLRKNLQRCTIPDFQNSTFEVTTFNETATILHLIYHLYMDTWLNSNNLYSIYSSRTLKKANRFLYRAYEIALFSEKYFEDIIWEDVIRDISNQKLRIIFKKMVLDIVQIFPDVFPKSVLDKILDMDYIEDERDVFYKSYLSSIADYQEKLPSSKISEFIEQERKKNNGLEITLNENISLEVPLKENENRLSCDIKFKRLSNDVQIIFDVSDDDFYFSEQGDYDTQASDGVHLILCGTEEYSYNSIFFFPKIANGEVKIFSVDVLNNANIEIDDSMIHATYEQNENSYTIAATLTEKFLLEHHLTSYFYMGLVISDCSSETKRRKNQIILSEDNTQWYNPIYFTRINLT